MRFTWLVCLLLFPSVVSAQAPDVLPRRADIGAQFISPAAGRPPRVASVEQTSRLFASGLRPKDEIVTINGESFTTETDFGARLAALKGGEQIRLVVQRGDERHEIAATLSPLAREQLDGVETVYTHITNPRGPRQRAIVTRPRGATERLPAILFVPWLSCDSVESPKGAAPGIDLLLQQIASRSGFVMTRVDKPGVGDSEGVCAATDLDTEIEGSRAALAWLRTHPWVDSRRIVLMGHSFSGAFLPAIAADTPVAGYIVLNGWVRTWFERLIEFERLRLESSRLSAAQVTDRMLALSEFYTMFLLQKKTPREVMAERPALREAWEDEPEHQYGRSAVFHHQLASFNPARGWSTVSVPTLAVWSEQDIVMHRRDHERLVAFVNANAPGAGRLLTMPGDHSLAAAGPDGRRLIPDGLLAAILTFLEDATAIR